MKITIVFDRIRGEEKWLVQEAKQVGLHTTELVDGRTALTSRSPPRSQEPLR